MTGLISSTVTTTAIPETIIGKLFESYEELCLLSAALEDVLSGRVVAGPQ